jgi:hypothetical protein
VATKSDLKGNYPAGPNTPRYIITPSRVTAPAIVRFDNIMPLRALAPELSAVNGPDREPVLVVWWCEPPCISATMQKWEDYLAGVKTVPDNALGKEHVIERAEYWIEVKRRRGDPKHRKEGAIS